MDNELDTLSAGELQPYNEGMPVLAPLSQDNWSDNGTLTNREINDYQRQPQGPMLFGAAMPAGTTSQQINVILGQLGAAFMGDMSQLNYPAPMVQAAINVLTANATKAPYQVTPKHNFNLHGQTDWLGHLFGNAIHELSGSPRAKQAFITAAITWLAKATAKLNKPDGSGDMPRTAPNSEDLTANLTDQQYATLVAHNNRVQAQTMATLERRWGSCFKINIELAQAQLNKQTPAELAHLDRYTGSWPWTHMFNTVELLTAMYDMAIGAGSIGTSGADIAREIASFEAMLKIPAERARYMRDPQMQARLRELYQRRGS